MAIKIDKMPPEMSGIAVKDMQNILDYIVYLRENVNFALEDMEKKIKKENDQAEISLRT